MLESVPDTIRRLVEEVVCIEKVDAMTPQTVCMVFYIMRRAVVLKMSLC